MIIAGALVLIVAIGIVSVALALSDADAPGDRPGARASPTPGTDPDGRTACAELVTAGSPLTELGGGALTPLPAGWTDEAYRLGSLAAQSSARPVRVAGRDLAEAIYLDEAVAPIDIYQWTVVLATACAEAGYVTSVDVRQAIGFGVG
jgi:hypothetical protein